MTPVKKFSVSLTDSALKAIARRTGDTTGERSGTISEMIERYDYLMSSERRELATLFTPGECGLLCDVFNGTRFAEPFSIQMVGAEIEDSYQDGYAEKWGVDRAQMSAKMAGITRSQQIALVDAVERWWDNQSAGGVTEYTNLFR